MPWHAFDAVDDALDSTRRFLFPFSFGKWLRLAVIVFFLGAGGSGGGNVSNAFNGVPDGGQPGGPVTQPTMPPNDVLWFIGIVVAAILLVALVFAIISATMRFVFVDALRTDDVRVRGPFKRRFGKGVRLFVFELVLGLLLLLPFIVGGLAVVFGFVSLESLGASFVNLGVGVIVLLGLLYVLAAIVIGFVLGFTNQFVVPVMIVEDSGVLAGWSRFWTTLRREWKQFVVYVFVRFVLQLGVGIATGIVGFILAIVVFLVAGAIGFGLAAVFGGFQALISTTAGIAALVVLVVLTILVMTVVFLPIKILVQTYFTTYELSVLGGVNPQYALLPQFDDGDDGESDDAGDGGDDGDGGDGFGDRTDRRDSAFGDDDTGSDDSSGNEFVWSEDDDANTA